MKIPRSLRSRGQSTVEFALMMPVIMAFFFWIFQVNIYYTALNQGAWAAYAGARTQLVLGGPSPKGSPQETVSRIMTGTLYQGSRAPTVEDGSMSMRGSGSTAQGVVVKLKALQTLPYVSSSGNGLMAPLLKFDTEVSTHLGWQEYDTTKWQSGAGKREKESPDEGARMITDNNLTDY